MDPIHACAANAPQPTIIRCLDPHVLRPDFFLQASKWDESSHWLPLELYVLLGVARNVEISGPDRYLIGEFEAFIGGVAGMYMSHRALLPRDACSRVVEQHVMGSPYGYQVSGVAIASPSEAHGYELSFKLQLLRYLDEPHG